MSGILAVAAPSVPAFVGMVGHYVTPPERLTLEVATLAAGADEHIKKIGAV